MSDHADKPSKQRPIPRLADLQVVRFIGEALRAGERAIFITGRGQVSTRVPEAALAACASASARALHIGPPLPEPPELQEMIGAAVEIAGGRDMTPQAMARLLLLADPRPTVILAIDDAHTLSHRSLCYLTLMTELLASDAPILQIVLAAGPALLDSLAQPEFETFRNKLCRPGFETFQTLRAGRANGAFSGLRKPVRDLPATGLARVQHADPMAAPPQGHGIAPLAGYAAEGVAALGCLAAIGYFAFSAFIAGPAPPPIPSLNSPAPQRFLAPSGPPKSLAQLAPRQTEGAIDLVIDDAVDSVANGSVELASTLLERIAKLEASASPEGLKLIIALPERVAARASAAAAAGRFDEARRLEQVYRLAYSAIGRPDLLTASNQRSFQSPLTATPGAAGASAIGGPAQQGDVAERPAIPPGGSALSAEQRDAAGDGDGAAPSPNKAAPSPPSVAPDQNVDAARPAAPAEAAATAPHIALSAERLGSARDGDRSALSGNPAAPAPASAAPDQNVDTARPAIVTEAAVTAPPIALSAERLGAAGDGDRAALPPNAAAPAPPSATLDQNVDAAAPAMLAKAERTAPDHSNARLTAGLPTLAPVRVVLNVARDDGSRARRSVDIQRALAVAGLEVSDLVPVDARQPGPSIGYYFQSDRNAAAEVSHLLQPLLGAVDPVALRMRGSIPAPGTIEIALP